eukprot:scaffold1878_cov258-Pinguiococcus_pyrenoidosus.AAC.17
MANAVCPAGLVASNGSYTTSLGQSDPAGDVIVESVAARDGGVAVLHVRVPNEIQTVVPFSAELTGRAKRGPKVCRRRVQRRHGRALQRLSTAVLVQREPGSVADVFRDSCNGEHVCGVWLKASDRGCGDVSHKSAVPALEDALACPHPEWRTPEEDLAPHIAVDDSAFVRIKRDAPRRLPFHVTLSIHASPRDHVPGCGQRIPAPRPTEAAFFARWRRMNERQRSLPRHIYATRCNVRERWSCGAGRSNPIRQVHPRIAQAFQSRIGDGHRHEARHRIRVVRRFRSTSRTARLVELRPTTRISNMRKSADDPRLSGPEWRCFVDDVQARLPTDQHKGCVRAEEGALDLEPHATFWRTIESGSIKLLAARASVGMMAKEAVDHVLHFLAMPLVLGLIVCLVEDIEATKHLVNRRCNCDPDKVNHKRLAAAG